MAETVGRVAYLKVATGYGWVNIKRESPPATELLIIWQGDKTEGPVALFTTELSMALARGLRVKIFHDDSSAYIKWLTVEAPP